MKIEMLSHRVSKKGVEYDIERLSVERTKRQRSLSNDILDWFSPKRYPSIFYDQRLRSRFFK